MLVNTVIIMLGAYTQPCQSASTPLSRFQCVNQSIICYAVVTHCTDVDAELAEVDQCRRTKQKGSICSLYKSADTAFAEQNGRHH